MHAACAGGQSSKADAEFSVALAARSELRADADFSVTLANLTGNGGHAVTKCLKIGR